MTENSWKLPWWVGDVLIIITIVISTALPTTLPDMLPGGQPAGPVSGGLTHFNAPWAIPAAVIAVCLLVLIRRLAPGTVYVATLVIYLVVAAVGLPALGPGIAAAVTAYTMAERSPRWRGFVFGGVGAVLVALLSLTMNNQFVFEPQVFQFAAAIATATALGDSARNRRDYANAMAERAERAEHTRESEALRRVAEERLRIAQDLHDTVAHRMSVISLYSGVASNAVEKNPAKAKEALGTIRDASREVLGDIGVLLRYLRADEDSTPAPQPGLGDIDELVDSFRRSGLDVALNVHGDIEGKNPTAGLVAYRVVQEGLTNAHKHGSSGTASVALDVTDGGISVKVANPVSATDRNQPDAPSGHMGLTGLRERVAAAGGTMLVEEVPNQQFVVHAQLPLHLEA